MVKRRWEFIAELVKENNYKTVAEIGVAGGETAEYIIRSCDLDCYIMVERRPPDVLYQRARECDAVDEYGITKRPLVFMRMASSRAAKLITDQSIDLVFLDAEHGYEHVLEDVQYWFPKVRKGGILCGHDYSPVAFLPVDVNGVTQAVMEVFETYNVERENDNKGDYNHVWWVKVDENISLRKPVLITAPRSIWDFMSRILYGIPVPFSGTIGDPNIYIPNETLNVLLEKTMLICGPNRTRV